MQSALFLVLVDFKNQKGPRLPFFRARSFREVWVFTSVRKRGDRIARERKKRGTFCLRELD